MINESTSAASAPQAARVARYLTLFRRFAAVIVLLVGVIALVVGGVLLASQRWPEVAATVQSCHTQAAPRANSHRTTLDTVCSVTWQEGGRTHSGTVNFGRTRTIGATAQLRVHGDTAVQPAPAWEGFVALGVGVVLLVVGGMLLVRSLSRPRLEPVNLP